ncbi:unnamed protein product, partial [marine sediment metagenome]
IFIENYEFDHIYNIFEPITFKIIPIAQDIQQVNLTFGNIVYPFAKETPDVGGTYFIREIQFNPLDFQFENQSIDTKIFTVKASDWKTQQIELQIPFTASVAMDTHLYINDLQIEKNFYVIDDPYEYVWWKIEEGGGTILYDASGN